MWKVSPPTDDGGLTDFYHNWTNSILQQMKRNFWKIADTLFRISTMTNSFTYWPGEYHPYSLGPDPQISRNCEASAVPRWICIYIHTYTTNDVGSTHILVRLSFKDEPRFPSWKSVVYYESRKRELKTWLMNESRCDERLKARVEESTWLTYTGLHDKTN
jgi:hypothetical protein